MSELLTTPLGWGLLVGLAGLALWAFENRWGVDRRRGPWLVTAAWVLLMVLAMQPVAALLSGPLERWGARWPAVPAWAEAQPPEAIVVFASGMTGVKVAGAPLDWGSLERLTEALKQARRWPEALVIFSGGLKAPLPSRVTGARRMAEVAIELGLEPERIIVEGKSRNTRENAAYCARILRERGIERVALVTSPMHMLRSRLALLKQGYASLPLPPPAPRLGPFRLGWFRPSDAAVQRTTWAVHEWIGLAWYRLRGWI